MVGQAISHYRITEKLGEGGMGVVYKAEDNRLHRTVALKFLRTETVEDEEFTTRLRHEAAAAAALDHPNICTVHEIDEVEGKIFLAMAFIEGETLARKIEKRPLPLGEALEIAVQVAEGLHAAHRKGIVHRDIKSANIMIDTDGRAKILDFGLAHLTGGTRITKAGTVIGTPAFMSPEQIRGEEVDHRTDIWALGAVIYEMVTGRLPFRGASEQVVALAIQNDEPEPITAQRAGLPIELEWIVQKALTKDPKERYQHVEEMAVDLRGLRRKVETGTSTISARHLSAAPVSTTTLPPEASAWRRLLPWAVSALAIVIAVAAVSMGLWTSRSRSPDVTRFSMDVHWKGGNARFVTQQPNIAMSPDGSRFVFASTEAGHQRLHLREMNESEARPIAGTDRAQSPFFSPDGESVAFLTRSRLKRVSLSTGSVDVICEVTPLAVAGTWTRNDTIIFSNIPGGGLEEVSASGGKPEVLTESDRSGGDWGHNFPRMLPGGKALLFRIGNLEGQYSSRLAALSLETGNWQPLLDTGTSPHFLPPRYLVYARASALYAAPFDPVRLEVTGRPVMVLDGVRTARGGEFSLSKDGSLVYLAGSRDWLDSRLVLVDRKGRYVPLGFPSAVYREPKYSPDGRFIAVGITDPDLGNLHIHVGDLKRGILRRLTSTPGGHSSMTWTPDGQSVLYGHGDRAPPKLHIRPADGSGSSERLLEMEWTQFPTSCSPDGQTLLFNAEHPDTNFDVWLFSMSERKARPFLHTTFNEMAARFSPNGEWVAYQSDESGRYEIYVRSAKGGGVQQISTGGGVEPVWARNGSELFYRNGRQMMAVAILAGAQLAASRPELLFEGTYGSGRHTAHYDVSPDGQRFLMVKALDESPTTKLHVVRNWGEEVRRLMESEGN